MDNKISLVGSPPPSLADSN